MPAAITEEAVRRQEEHKGPKQNKCPSPKGNPYMGMDRTSAFRKRVRRLGRAVSRRRLDAICITHPPNIAYLTGFTGEDSWFLLAGGRPILLTDSRFTEQAALDSPWCEPVARTTPLLDALSALVRRFAVRRLAFEETHLSAADWRKAGSSMPGVEIEGLAGVVEKMRLIKDAGEVRLIRKAQRCLEKALRKLIKDGATGLLGKSENETAARLEFEMRLAGASGTAFDTIVAVGRRASLPHARPGDNVVASGEPLLVDAGARLDGYNSDLTRTWFPNRIPARLAGIYDVVLEAQCEAIRAVRPGVRLVRVDEAARKVIERAGFGRYFGHGTGHGVGLEVHEGPSVAPRSRTVAKPGMVFTIEPGIYIPGLGGVRIEDMVIVTDDGCSVITSFPKARRTALLRS